MAALHDVISQTPTLAALGQAGEYAAIANWLGGCDLQPNPVEEAPQVPAPVTLKQVIALVPPGEMAKIYKLSGFVADVRDAIDHQDREYLGALLQVAAANGDISAATVTALGGLLAATVPDPAWRALVPGAPRWVGFGLSHAPTAADVQAAVLGV